LFYSHSYNIFQQRSLTPSFVRLFIAACFASSGKAGKKNMTDVGQMQRRKHHMTGLLLSSYSPYGGCCSRKVAVFIDKCNASICDLSDINSAVILCIFASFCPVTDISATVTPIDVNFSTMVHIDFGHKFSPFGGGTLNGPQNLKF